MGDWVRAALRRLRRNWRFVVETTVAASVAFLISYRVLDHAQPFFAPAAAILVLGAARGQRRGRAVEVVLGVAAGVLVADVVAWWLGPGTTLSVFVVIALTAVVVVVLGTGTVLMVQALVSAVYVAVVTPVNAGLVPTRFIDALVGGGVALAVTMLAGASDPIAPAARAATALFHEVAEILREVETALRDHDEAKAVEALDRARAADARVDTLRTAVEGAHESMWLTVRAAGRGEALGGLESAVTQGDYLVRNVRVLARAAVVVVRDETPAPEEMLRATSALAAAVSLMGSTYDNPSLREDVRAAAIDAVALAGTVIPSGIALPQVTIVGQLRAAAVDLLRASGMAERRSIDLVDDALAG